LPGGSSIPSCCDERSGSVARRVEGQLSNLSPVRSFQHLDPHGDRRFWGPARGVGGGSQASSRHQRKGIPPWVSEPWPGKGAWRRGDGDTPERHGACPLPPLCTGRPSSARVILPPEHPRGAAGAHASKHTARHQFMSTGSSRCERLHVNAPSASRVQNQALPPVAPRLSPPECPGGPHTPRSAPPPCTPASRTP
jgi:hypothetical protein